MADLRLVIYSRGLFFLSLYKMRLLETVGGHGKGWLVCLLSTL